jgi:hypothetical protein
MCGIFGLFEVKVPVIFSGTEGFPPRRDGRYSRIWWKPRPLVTGGLETSLYPSIDLPLLPLYSFTLPVTTYSDMMASLCRPLAGDFCYLF